MKYHELIRVLTEEPLLITPAAHGALFQLFKDHRELERAEFRAAREGVDLCGEAVELEQMEVIDGIAHIPIRGPLGAGLSKFEKGAGATDVADIAADLDAAEDDPNVAGILLDMDSPGGMVSGIPELADRILAVDKPLYAFTCGLMCSAAYWLASAADMVLATKSAEIGAIGVYVPMLDSSARMQALGYKVEVITSGKYKGIGVPGTALTDAHREFMQARVEEIAGMFYDHVGAMRPDLDREDMQGQTYKGQKAAARGLIDQVVSGKDEALALLLG